MLVVVEELIFKILQSLLDILSFCLPTSVQENIWTPQNMEDLDKSGPSPTSGKIVFVVHLNDAAIILLT